MDAPPKEEYHCLVDSTTVLYWIKGQGTWSQFVRNRTKAIQDKEYLRWHHVPTAENPSDQGSRGMAPSKMGEMWFRGPNWLSTQEEWPDQSEVTQNSGRVPHYHPVFLPQNSKLASLIERMLHGGVSITMCLMREKC